LDLPDPEAQDLLRQIIAGKGLDDLFPTPVVPGPGTRPAVGSSAAKYLHRPADGRDAPTRVLREEGPPALMAAPEHSALVIAEVDAALAHGGVGDGQAFRHLVVVIGRRTQIRRESIVRVMPQVAARWDEFGLLIESALEALGVELLVPPRRRRSRRA
jgi:hypothetical protein